MSVSKARVLFVDDDPFFSDMGQETLREHEYSVVTAVDGHEALELIEQELFDLIILDNEMPGICGFEVIERMRRMENGSNVPVIMVTGSDDEASINKAFDVGADSFLAKPFDWSLLVHQSNFVLKASRATRELREALNSQQLLRSMQERFVQTLIDEGQEPLKTAVNFARIMKLEADGPLGSAYYRSCVDEISQAMDRVDSTFVKLVHRSDFGAQVAKLDESVCCVRELVAENVNWARSEAHRRNIDVIGNIAVDPNIQMRCDRILAGHAIKTVMQNAIAGSPRGVSIKVSVLCDVKDGLRLTVDENARVGATNIRSIEKKNESSIPLAFQTCKVVIDAHGGTLKIEKLEHGKRTEILIPSDRMSDARDGKLEYSHPEHQTTTSKVAVG